MFGFFVVHEMECISDKADCRPKIHLGKTRGGERQNTFEKEGRLDQR